MFHRWVNLLIITTMFLYGCGAVNETAQHDPTINFKKQDYDTLTEASPTTRTPKKIRNKRKKKPEPTIPAKFYKTVTLTTTEAIPLTEILLTMAQQAGVDIILDPKISTGANISTTNRPLIHIVEEICKSHGLRYSVNHSLLKVEVDTPYMHNYNLQFLILSRENKNRLSIATDVFTGADSNARPDEDNGSNTTLNAETKTNFWEELNDNLSIILTDFTNSGGNDAAPQAKFTIHKQAGIISIYANQAKHKQIDEYLKVLRESVEKQVLIEAKIVEVNLNSEFKTGVNWDVLRGNFAFQAPMGSITIPGNLDKLKAPPRNIFSIGGSGNDITGMINMLNHFGTVRTLSNPRLTVMNNNPAVLKVAKNKVYFKLTYTRDYNHFDHREHTSYSSDIKTVPIGLMMYVHPTIRDDGKIIMTLRPTISQISREVPDPAVDIASGQTVQSLIPEVQVRELDSVLSMNSGEIIVVGGLMEERSANDRNGIPETEDIPIFDRLFNAKENDRSVSELVIFIRATIIENEPDDAVYDTSTVHNADKSAYNNFTKDPRPLKF